MVFVAHKYMPDQIPVEELRATFAARHHTLRYLVKSLRDQAQARTLTSYLITGPRGSGKTTLIRMLCLKLDRNRALREAWLPVRFPEELPTVTSLRDLLAKALEVLADTDIPGARDWHSRVEEQTDETEGQDIAIAGLQWIAREQKRRLILFVENLDLVFDRGLTNTTQATLRRLLMTEPFMMIVGSAVQPFPELQSYDRAFFNYFCPVELEPLSETQAYRILKRRAKWDGNNDFERIHREHAPKIRAISLLTGGNPRLLLMLYEILTRQDVQSAVQALRRLVDELTPLLKDILEHQLTKQQVKLVDALMQLDGNATPSQIAGKSRLSLNIVTTQLKRLEQTRIVALTGGGKGRPAWYSIRDRLFYTWYQMRYLQPGRRRIELFVQVLQIWFEADERMEWLRNLSDAPLAGDNAKARAEAAEYFAVSLVRTQHEESARQIAIKAYLRAGQPDSAVGLFSEFEGRTFTRGDVSRGYIGLTRRLRDQGDIKEAIELARKRAQNDPENAELLLEYGIALALSANHTEALACFDQIAACPKASPESKALAFYNRGVARKARGDVRGAIEDYTSVIGCKEVSARVTAMALSNRGIAKNELGDTSGEMADYTAAIELEGVPPLQIAIAALNRAAAKHRDADISGAIADYTHVIELNGVPSEQIMEALARRAMSKAIQGDTGGAIADYTAVVERKGAPSRHVVESLYNRGLTKLMQGDTSGAIADYTAVIKREDAPPDQIASSLNMRGLARGLQRDTGGAIDDHTAVILREDAPRAEVAQALHNRGLAKAMQGDKEGAFLDLVAAVRIVEASPHDGILAGTAAIRAAVVDGNENVAKEVISILREWLIRLTNEERAKRMVECLAALADAGAPVAWLYVFKELSKDQPEETLKELAFLRPVADVLESGDLSRLDALAPEQRDFALQVLAKLGVQPPSGDEGRPSAGS